MRFAKSGNYHLNEFPNEFPNNIPKKVTFSGEYPSAEISSDNQIENCIEIRDAPVFKISKNIKRIKKSEIRRRSESTASSRIKLLRRDSVESQKEFNPYRSRLSFVKSIPDPQEESLLRSAIQIIVASLCAGFGNIGAGIVLDIIQKWRAFVDIDEMFILVPSLLGLKGNLEMTMASRLSTEANLGHMEKWSKILRMIAGDMVMVQCQATVVSFLASIVAIVVNIIQNGNFIIANCLDIIATSMISANIACFFLGLVMVTVIVFSHKYSINPDNIATPIAASLGDVSTAGIFALCAQMIHNDTISRVGSLPIAAVVTIILFMLLLPIFYLIARRNNFTHGLIHTGWGPIIIAMAISSGGGLFLNQAVSRYDRLPPFQPVICGVGGNYVAISASRISTWLFKNAEIGQLPIGVKRFSSPIKAFLDRHNINTKFASILLLLSLPSQLLYAFVIWGIQKENTTLTAPLILFYVLFSVIQCATLLYIGFNLVHYLWSRSINPDNSAIPILTSLGDFIGSAFIFLTFIILESLGDPNAIHDHTYDSVSNLTVTII